MLEKIKDYLKLNSYLVWICFLLFCIATIVIISGLKSDIKNTNQEFKKAYTQMKALIEKEVSGVVVLANSGHVLNVEKNYLDATTESSYNAAIKNVLINYLVFSNDEIRAMFATTKINSTQELLQGYKPLKEFQDNFLISQKTKDKKEIANKYWEYLLEEIIKGSNDRKIPDIVDIIDSTTDCSWDRDYKNFKINIKVAVNAYFWNSITNEFEETRGYFIIKALGTVAIKDNTVLNPLGIKFNTLELNMPVRNR